MPPAAVSSLERCVGDVEHFLEKVWSISPHLHERSGNDTFSDLLALEQVDQILSTTALRAPAFRLVKGGKPLPSSSYLRSGRMGSRTVTDLPDTSRIWEHFHDGATIVLQGLQRWWGPLTRFCRGLELTLTHLVQANAYITPPGSQGLAVHRDAHDVFAMQTYGRKRWVLYDPMVADSSPGPRWSRPLSDLGEPTLDLELHPGDCLYVPQGTYHAAATVDFASIHITIGIRSVTWHDVFTRLFANAPSSFLQALPVGFARDPQRLETELADRLRELSAWIAGQDPTAMAADAQRRFWASCQPVYTDQLQQLLGLDRIDDETQVERQPLAMCALARVGDRLEVILGDRRIRMPGHVEPAMQTILDRGRLRVRDLADHLDVEGRRVLVRRLVREGLLRVTGEGGESRT